MTLQELSRSAVNGSPVYLPDVRSAIAADQHVTVRGLLTLPDAERTHGFDLVVPRGVIDHPRELTKRYLAAEIYNRLASLGGTRLHLHATDQSTLDLLAEVIELFQIGRSRESRTGYGRIVNMLDRMLTALHPESGPFSIELLSSGVVDQQSEHPVSFRTKPTEVFARVTTGLDDLSVCGMDIGGTDIKAILAVDGRIVALKEYDWNPGAYAEVEKIIDPMIGVVRLMSLVRELMTRSGSEQLAAAVELALRPESSMEEIEAALRLGEESGYLNEPAIDAIGLCFPDVVVRNRIVGGEVPKTRAMRLNTGRDFEEQFEQLTTLNARLETLTRTGVVMNTNDGPMAAFTAAVELAAAGDTTAQQGVFAHTLGTDLGSGLALADGTIPEIPLELYNLILDVGSDGDRALDPADLRSIANTNTGLSGTPQKIASQAAAFRFFDRLASAEMRQAAADAGYVRETNGVRAVPEEPKDLRKPFLAWLMERASEDESVADVFRAIGEVVAIVSEETERIMDTGLTRRYLFGRFVKVSRAFELLSEGASKRTSGLQLVAVNEDVAHTKLMKDLAANEEYTVAQFGQAVGAIYLANLGLQQRR